MLAKEISKPKRKRIHWMDNLRTILILLVVVYHIGGVYEAAGLWSAFWIVDDPDTISWVGIVGIVFDIFVMPTMFFIAGYLTPPSLNNKTAWGFVKRKVRRLLLPWAIAVLTLIPLYKVIFLYSRGLPQEHWTTYFHFSQGNISSQNWLWFLPLLFVFDMLYLLGAQAKVKLPNLSLRAAVTAVFALSFAYSFGIGWVVGFRSWTLSPLLDFENERLVMYFLVFLLGTLYFQKDAFAEKPTKRGLYMLANALAWLPVTGHILVRLIPFFDPAGFAVTPFYRFLYWISFDLSLLFIAYLMVESFWRYVDRTGPIWRELNQNSYGVYINHVIVLGVFGTLMLNWDVSPLVKYPVLIISTYVVSNLIVSLYNRLVQGLRPRRRQPVRPAVDVG